MINNLDSGRLGPAALTVARRPLPDVRSYAFKPENLEEALKIWCVSHDMRRDHVDYVRDGRFAAINMRCNAQLVELVRASKVKPVCEKELVSLLSDFIHLIDKPDRNFQDLQPQVQKLMPVVANVCYGILRLWKDTGDGDILKHFRELHVLICFMYLNDSEPAMLHEKTVPHKKFGGLEKVLNNETHEDQTYIYLRRAAIRIAKLSLALKKDNAACSVEKIG